MTKPTITTQELQRRIGHRAKSAPEHRFWGLHVHLVKLDTLEAAYLEAKRNRGAPGADGETFETIECRGRGEFLEGLAAELRDGTYRPRPYRRREIPKEGGKVRVISIPTIRDRVVQGALRLLLEPIFEADFSRHSYGARPGRSAHDAIGEVRSGLIWKKGSSSKVGAAVHAARRRGMGGVMPRARKRRTPSVLRMGLAIMKRSLRSK
jgi:RNA-directed DNA polymerase